MATTLIHISDLHIGRDARSDRRAAHLARALADANAEAILLTGDVTHRGRRAELERFEELFARIRATLIIVPGNHDRIGDDVATLLMGGPRVQVDRRDGLYVVRVDSTAAHNRSPIDSHGELTNGDVEAVVAAVDCAPEHHLVVVMLHHHVLPLPEDHLGERLATFLGWPCADELPLGLELISRIGGRCQLIVHGHRHRAGEVTIGDEGGRDLQVLNAGSSPQLGRVREVTYQRGRVCGSRWLEIGDAPRPAADAAVVPILGPGPLQPDF